MSSGMRFLVSCFIYIVFYLAVFLPSGMRCFSFGRGRRRQTSRRLFGPQRRSDKETHQGEPQEKTAFLHGNHTSAQHDSFLHALRPHYMTPYHTLLMVEFNRRYREQRLTYRYQDNGMRSVKFSLL